MSIMPDERMRLANENARLKNENRELRKQLKSLYLTAQAWMKDYDKLKEKYEPLEFVLSKSED